MRAQYLLNVCFYYIYKCILITRAYIYMLVLRDDAHDVL
jgi:hypothetical protein